MLPAAAAAVILTMMSMAQVFERQRWFLPALLAVGLAFGSGWVARRLDVPGVLSPAISLLALVTLLGIVFLPETTAAGLPTAATMQGIGEALSAAGTDIRELAPPAPATDALTLLATAGAFLVAMVVDTIVFGLRRPVAAGLPLLALYLIPTSMAKTANVFAFVLAAVGYLGLLVAEGRDRARNWGRRLSGMDLVDDVADVSHVARVGRRIGSAAVGVALCVPIVVPTVGEGIFGGTGGGLFGRGDGSRRAFVFNPIVEIRTRIQIDDEAVVLRVRTATPDYLRLATLDTFDGSSWKLEEREAPTDNRVGPGKEIRLPKELDNIETSPARYDVFVEALDVNWLPVPYAPYLVEVGKDGDWRWEENGRWIFSSEKKSLGERFTAEARRPRPTDEQLRAPGDIPDDIRDKFLQLPQGDAPQLALDVLERVTAGAETPYDRAVALNKYFKETGGFSYDLNVAQGNSVDNLTEFLTNKVGYCEQFATAMAYLSRLAGIPSRVVVGFTPGHLENSEWVITNRDAHAWPELYFPDTGWVRFEPTPRGGTVLPDHLVPDGPAVVPTAPPSVTPSATPSGAPSATASPKPRQVPEPEPEDAPPGQQGGGKGDSGLPLVPVGAGAAALALATPTFVAWGTRRRRRRPVGDHVGRIHAAWESLADAAEDAGHPLRAADSPRGAARRLVASAALTGPVADEVLRLAAAEERARYARTVAPVDGLDGGVRSVRKAMIAALPNVARARATVFPASAMRRIRAGLATASTTADRLRDRIRAKAAGLVRRRPKPA